MKSPNVLNAVAIAIAILVAAPALATTWYVNADGGGDMPTIQAALDACAENDSVLVATGTYFENLVWPATQGLVLTSESGPEATIVDGSASGRVITMEVPLDASTTISYLTIQNGYLIGSGLDASGGGILCLEGASPTIMGNIITGNIIGGPGVAAGGIGCFDCAPVIIENVITHNEIIYGSAVAGAGIGVSNSSARIVGNHIALNIIAPAAQSDAGGGIAAAYGSTPLIQANTIELNSGGLAAGGIYILRSAGTVTGNLIRLNTADFGGGIMLQLSSTNISDNLITKNAASVDGGGIKCRSHPETGSATLYNNEITHNSCPAGGGGGIHLDGSSPTIERCTVQDNGIGIYCDIQDDEVSQPSISYNSIYENADFGLVNSYANPTVDATLNWWGDASGPYHATFNPDGLGNAVSDDVLFDPWLIFTDVSDAQTPAAVTLAQNYPNPFNPRTTISFALDRSQWARVAVYELSGRRVAVLAEQSFTAGQHELTWNGCDSQGRELPSGAYFVRLETDSVVETRKAVLLR